MLDTSHRLPASCGVGYKPQHYLDILDTPDPIGWLEIHAENYMGQGGRPLAQLAMLAERFPISVHGVGLSIGGDGPLDREHLERLKRLLTHIPVASFSEHLAWSTHSLNGTYFNDLLPLPYTTETLKTVCAHVAQAQDALGRKMLLENPSSYLTFADSTWGEVEFLTEVVARTGCGLLLDVNNVFVSATNLHLDPRAYIDAFPHEHVGEIHLAGHEEDEDDEGYLLLIDSHGKPVAEPVWALYAHTIARSGPKPTLIEWDNDIPPWDVLRNEATRAEVIMTQETK